MIKQTKKSTIQYLIDNDLDIGTALFFTCRDYDFCLECVPQKIIINQNKIKKGVSCQEVLTKKDIELRVKDLYLMMKKDFVKVEGNVDMKQVEDLLKRINKNK